ncbi:MAG: hypothetical protein JNL11_19230 [Bdellovibrionaceae bacterium]|nr:hypothetical protein [Pseudobdellovibrionaceae bacterium]
MIATWFCSSTGEIIAAIDNEIEGPVAGNNFGSESFSSPTDWTVAVQKFVDAYPKDYKPQYYTPFKSHKF